MKIRQGTGNREFIGRTALLMPAILLLIAGFFLPLISLFSISIYKGISGTGNIDTTVITLDNFVRMLGPYSLTVIWRTFRLAIYATLLSLFLGYPIAIAMVKANNKIKNIMLALMLTPLLTNVVARTLGLMIFFGHNGPMNKMLTAFGIGKVKFVPGELGIVIGLTQVFIPYMILSVRSVLENVDFALEEAARDAGCSRMGAFAKVTLPLSVPGIVAGSLFVFLLSFSSFVTPQLMGGGTVMTITMLIYQQSMVLLDWPFAAAAAIILLLFSLLLLTIYGKLTSRIERMGDSLTVERKPTRLGAYFSQTSRKVKNGLYDSYAYVVRKLRALVTHRENLSLSQSPSNLLAALGRIAGIFMIVLGLVFIILPLPVVLLSSFSGEQLLVNFPPKSYSLQWYQQIFQKTEYIRGFLLSLRIALISVGVSLTVGILASWALTRYRFRGRELMKTLFLSPLSLPAVIMGISTLRLFIRLGMVGSLAGILLAHITITTAYVIRSILSSLVGFDMMLEEAARDLGAKPFYTFRKVTFPIIRPGIIVGGLFAFIVSMDETTVSRFIVRGSNITLPVRIFADLEFGVDLTITAISTMLIVMALIVLVLIDRTLGLNKFKM